jgi:hypothetical protein
MAVTQEQVNGIKSSNHGLKELIEQFKKPRMNHRKQHEY